MKYKIIFCLMVSFSMISLAAQAQTSAFTDSRDGRIYQTVKIGDQWWMTENLNFSMPDSWCYNKDSANCSNYGRLYTYDAAKESCPSGWHLPGDEEWTTLVDYLGGEETAGKKLTLTGNKTLGSKYAGVTNETGFSATAGGNRNVKNVYALIGKYGMWWSSTEYNATEAYSRYLYLDNAYFYSHYDKKNCAFSVRCLKNQ